jgi:hypothetical protein
VYREKVKIHLKLIHALFKENYKNEKEFSSLFAFTGEERKKVIYAFAKTMGEETLDLASPAKISLEVGTKDLPEFFNFYFDSLP